MVSLKINHSHVISPPSRFKLLDGTGAVGWIDVNRVQFTGFANPGEAAAAAWVAHVALERRWTRSSREAPPSSELPRLFLVRADGREWITAAGERLARLVRPNSEDDSLQSPEVRDVSARLFGFEIAFPPDASELTVGSGAHVIYVALRRSGLPWSARSRDDAPAARTCAAALAAAEHQSRSDPGQPRIAYAGIGG
jgi:hypothetical protein